MQAKAREESMDSFSFEKVAPYLKDPLVLVGFALLLFFGFARTLFRSGLLKPVAGQRAYRVLQAVVLYGFVLGVLVVVLGFGLKYRDLSEADRRGAVQLLKGEFDANAATVESLRRNTVTMLSVFQETAQVLREPGIKTLATLFPKENVAGTQLPPRDMAVGALSSLLEQQLDRNKAEMAKGDAAAKVLVGTIGRTRATIVSLSDPSHERYVITDQAWRANLPMLHRVHLASVPEFQRSYDSSRKLRSDYDVVCAGLLAYLDALRTLFNPKTGVDVEVLAATLAQERQSLALLTAYGKSLSDATEQVRQAQQRLAPEAKSL
jgi:hypothetical protein